MPIVVPPDLTLDAPADGYWSMCSLWWQHTPLLANERVGLIGAFHAEDQASAQRVLERACARLARRGCTLAVGPMDGSTWNSYRFITEWGTEPTFFLEPSHLPEGPLHFRRAGFSEIARYSSRLQPVLIPDDPRLPRVVERLQALGATIRSLDRSRMDGELQNIFRVVTAAFRGSFLHTPIPYRMFRDLYAPLLVNLEAALVLLAEHGDQCVGFALGVPDLLERRREGGARTLIVKTVAVLPDRRYAGLGRLLWLNLCSQAAGLGHTRAINALMHDGGHSFNMSQAHSLPMRRYALFARRL